MPPVAYATQSILVEAPSWWNPKSEDDKAISTFDRRHARSVRRCGRMRTALTTDPTSLSKGDNFHVALWELTADRYVLESKLDQVRTFAKREKPKAKLKWTLVDSIWKARLKVRCPLISFAYHDPSLHVVVTGGPLFAVSLHSSARPPLQTSDAHAFYDTAEVKRATLTTDWEMAMSRQSLEKKLARVAKSLPSEDQAHTTPSNVMEVMLEHFNVIYSTHIYLCSLSAGDDIYSMPYNAFLQFLNDASLVDEDVEGQRSADYQLLFEGVNATATKSDVFNSRRELNRSEWVGLLLQIALARYVVGKKMAIATAIQQLLAIDIPDGLTASCAQDSNAYRSDYCYVESTDVMLRKFERSLRALYSAFALGTGAIGDQLSSIKLMDYKEFMSFIDAIDLVDEFLTLREVRLAFLWSRMVVINENSQRGRASFTQLRFEDYLEVIVRLSHLAALPTNEDMASAGCSHAGEYLLALKHNPAKEAEFKKARSQDFDQHPDRPISQKLRLFMHNIIFKVRGGYGSLDKELSEKEAVRFARGEVREPQLIASVDVDAPSTAAEEVGHFQVKGGPDVLTGREAKGSRADHE